MDWGILRGLYNSGLFSSFLLLCIPPAPAVPHNDSSEEESNAERLEEHVNYFMQHKEERVEYQTVFAGIGKTGILFPFI